MIMNLILIALITLIINVYSIDDQQQQQNPFDTYYVDPSASGTSQVDGKSWNKPFTKLKDALSAASKINDQIWIKGGYTIAPDKNTERDHCFEFVTGVQIFGGFKGTEMTPDERPTSEEDQETYKTIISGEIGDTNDITDNCYHVITYEQILSLDRITISGGYADYQDYDPENKLNSSLHRYGGALITSDESFETQLNITDCTIENNYALNGGALWFGSSDNQDALTGGNPVKVNIKGTKFYNNHAIDSAYEGGYAGAIYTFFLAQVIVADSQFINNTAANKGGAIYQDYGGSFICNLCTFERNIAGGYGGAIFSEDRNSQTDGTFPIVETSTFIKNEAGIFGGAICWYNGVIGTVKGQTSFGDNKAMYGGAIALINSEYSGETQIGEQSFSNNIATEDSSVANEYITDQEYFTGLDEELSIDIAEHLETLYDRYVLHMDDFDVYPFDENSDLCFVAADTTAQSPDGLSWNGAYGLIQDCLDALEISGGEIWVKAGTYTPTDIPDWKLNVGANLTLDKSFIMYDNIRMYGGFAGDETSRDERNFLENPTYLSCDLSDENVDGIYCSQIMMGADNTLVDGFIFRDAGLSGIAEGTRRRMASSTSEGAVLAATDNNVGSGIFMNSTTMTVVNTIFYELFSSGKGGAIYCIGYQGVWEGVGTIKSPEFINTAFLGNRADVRGGAISADLRCNFKCNYCLFDSNSCSKKGGAIYLDFDSDPEFENTVFSNNYAFESGGCLGADGKSNVTFYNGTFNDNWAKYEGGCLYAGSGAGLRINQGFVIYGSTMQDNYVENVGIRGYGQPNVYLWPYSTVEFVDSDVQTTTRTPVTTKSPDTTGMNMTISPSDEMEASFVSSEDTEAPTNNPTVQPIVMPIVTETGTPTMISNGTGAPFVSSEEPIATSTTIDNIDNIDNSLIDTSTTTNPPKEIDHACSIKIIYGIFIGIALVVLEL